MIRLLATSLGQPAVAVHGGAGTGIRRRGDELHQRELGGMGAALEAAWAVLGARGAALDAVVAAVAVMEDDGSFNAGRGAVATAQGVVETDAAVMDGATGTAGAICAATWPANPVRAARAVLATGDSLLLAGAGADGFAEGAGLPRRHPDSLTHGGVAPVSEMGTVGAVAVDAGGHLAAATSTGGRPGQRSGRVGDSPVLGAGTWARDGTVALSATGAGEAFVLAGFAHLVDWNVRAGIPLAEAATAALEEVARWGGSGGAVMMGPGGDLVALCDTPAMARGWRGTAGRVVEVLGAED